MNSDKEEDETKNIEALLIIEVLGRPPEHVTETIENIIKMINEEKGISVISKKVHEPVLVKEQKDLYTSYAEIEVKLEEIMHLILIMFKYMPSHIEILYPESIKLTNNGWNEILNELSRRLHKYDELARVVQAERVVLESKLKELLNKEKNPENNKKNKKPEKKNKKNKQK